MRALLAAPMFVVTFSGLSHSPDPREFSSTRNTVSTAPRSAYPTLHTSRTAEQLPNDSPATTNTRCPAPAAA
jgi:hypothetical protein